MDNVDKKTRSRIMARIRSSGTSIEKMLAKEIANLGLRTSNKHRLPCKPDLWFPTARVAVFCDGDFWHRCPVHASDVDDPSGKWQKKFSSNVSRDRRNEVDLIREGVLPVRVWECEIRRRPKTVAAEIASIVHRLEKKETSLPELAWASGIIDGEGSITVQGNCVVRGGKTRDQSCPFMCVGMSRESICEHVADVLGVGSVSVWSTTRKTMFKWRTSGARRTSSVLRAVKCLLLLKRPQAELVTIWASSVQTDMARKPVTEHASAERQTITQHVRSMNSRGVPFATWTAQLSGAALNAWKLRRLPGTAIPV